MVLANNVWLIPYLHRILVATMSDLNTAPMAELVIPTSDRGIWTCNPSLANRARQRPKACVEPPTLVLTDEACSFEYFLILFRCLQPFSPTKKPPMLLFRNILSHPHIVLLFLTLGSFDRTLSESQYVFTARTRRRSPTSCKSFCRHWVFPPDIHATRRKQHSIPGGLYGRGDRFA